MGPITHLFEWNLIKRITGIHIEFGGLAILFQGIRPHPDTMHLKCKFILRET